MNVDVNSLFFVTVHVEAMLGLLLLFAWVQNTKIYAVAWWGSAHLLRALSIMLFGLYGSAPEWVSIDLANVLLFTAFAVTWAGAQVFDGRKPEPLYLVAGAVIWLLLSRLPWIADSRGALVLLSAGIITSYTWLTALEFLAISRGAVGLALAGDLHAVRAWIALPVAHASERHAALVAGRPDAGECLAHGPKL